MPWMKRRDGDTVRVFKRGADGQPEGKARGTFTGGDADERADAQLAVLYAAERQESERTAKYDGLNLTPPNAVRAVCQRGLAQDGGTELQRQTAEIIASGKALTPRTIRTIAKQFNKGRKDGDEVVHLLRGGDPGASWFKTVAAALDRVDAGESVKSITASAAGSVGFSVPEDAAEGLGKAVTMREGMKVYIKTANEIGVIKAVVPFGNRVRYRVKTDTGVYLCGRGAITSAQQKAIKDAAKAYDAIQAAETDASPEAVEEAVRSFAESWKIADMPTRTKMQKARLALVAAKAIQKVTPDAAETIKTYLGMAKAELAPLTADEEPPAKGLQLPAKVVKALTPDEDALFGSLRRQHRNWIEELDIASDEADRQRIERRIKIVADQFTDAVKMVVQRVGQQTPAAAIKTIRDTVTAIATGKATPQQQEAMLDAVESLHEYAAAKGAAAVKSLVPLEEELYAEPDEGLTEWQAKIVKMIDEYQAKIAAEAPQV